jgi:hypothetical protein
VGSQCTTKAPTKKPSDFQGLIEVVSGNSYGINSRKKNPVRNRITSILIKVFPSQIKVILKAAPSSALTRKTFEGENRSAIAKSAYMFLG